MQKSCSEFEKKLSSHSIFDQGGILHQANKPAPDSRLNDVNKLFAGS